MHVAAHGQEEAFSAAECAVFVPGQQPAVDQFRRAAHAVDELADPVERLEIAQAALAVLHIGFDDIAAVAHALVARVALLQLLREKCALVALDNLKCEAPLAFGIEVAVTPDVAPFEQRGADRQIVLRQPDRLVQRAGGMADLEAEVPQEVEHCLHHLFAPGIAPLADQEGDVDIGVRGHFRAPVSAHRHDREPFSRGAIGCRIDVMRDVLVDDPHELVDEEGIAARNGMACGRTRFQPPLHFRAARLQRFFQRGNDLRTRLGALLPGQRLYARGERLAIDDRAPVGDLRFAQLETRSLAKVALTVRLSTFCVPRRGRWSSERKT